MSNPARPLVRIDPPHVAHETPLWIPVPHRFHACHPEPSCKYCSSSSSGVTNRNDWSFLDAAYCISLQSRSDRAFHAMQELHRVGLCRHCIFYRPTRGTGSVKKNIWNSHLAVALHARARGAQLTLVLEDDIQFSRTLDYEAVTSIRDAISSLPDGWMAFYLGHWPLSVRRVSPQVLRTRSLCTHAYVASRNLTEWICGTSYSEFKRLRERGGRSFGGGGIDAAFSLLPRMYAISPMVARQCGSPSDHRRRTSRALERCFYELKMRAREYFLANHAHNWERLIVALSSLASLVPSPSRKLIRLSKATVGLSADPLTSLNSTATGVDLVSDDRDAAASDPYAGGSQQNQDETILSRAAGSFAFEIGTVLRETRHRGTSRPAGNGDPSTPTRANRQPSAELRTRRIVEPARRPIEDHPNIEDGPCSQTLI